MIVTTLATLLLLASQEAEPSNCAPDSPVRDPKVCEPLFSEGEFAIYSMESVAVGTVDEIKNVRELTRHCNVSNRIDYVGSLDFAIYDIIDADEQSRDCVRGTISESTPELVFSEQTYDRKLQEATASYNDSENCAECPDQPGSNSLSPATPAAAAHTPISIGETHMLAYPAGEARQVNVYLPDAYAEGEESYPVLYLIDGGLSQDFLHVTGTTALNALWVAPSR